MPQSPMLFVKQCAPPWPAQATFAPKRRRRVQYHGQTRARPRHIMVSPQVSRVSCRMPRVRNRNESAFLSRLLSKSSRLTNLWQRRNPPAYLKNPLLRFLIPLQSGANPQPIPRAMPLREASSVRSPWRSLSKELQKRQNCRRLPQPTDSFAKLRSNRSLPGFVHWDSSMKALSLPLMTKGSCSSISTLLMNAFSSTNIARWKQRVPPNRKSF